MRRNPNVTRDHDRNVHSTAQSERIRMQDQECCGSALASKRKEIAFGMRAHHGSTDTDQAVFWWISAGWFGFRRNWQERQRSLCRANVSEVELMWRFLQIPAQVRVPSASLPSTRVVSGRSNKARNNCALRKP